MSVSHVAVSVFLGAIVVAVIALALLGLLRLVDKTITARVVFAVIWIGLLGLVAYLLGNAIIGGRR